MIIVCCMPIPHQVVMNTNGYSLPVDIWSLGCTVLEMATSKPPWSQYEGVRHFNLLSWTLLFWKMLWHLSLLIHFIYQVAAIFKIGNSKDTPEIPDHLSADAKNFIRLCLQREPSARPTASKLLSHPFVRNQATARGNANITREAFPRAFDGSRTPVIFSIATFWYLFVVPLRIFSLFLCPVSDLHVHDALKV